MKARVVDKLKPYIGIGLLFIFLTANASDAQEYKDYKKVPGVINIQSTFSDGRYTIKEIAAKVSDKGVKVVVLTDSLLRRWEYGIWPFENLIKRKVEESSVLKLGVGRYFNDTDRVQKTFSHLVILPAVEVSPFYFWEGNIFKGKMSLNNWHKHMLVVGLDEEGCKKLPVVSSYSIFPSRRSDFLRLWPIITILSGIFLIRLRTIRRVRWGVEVYSFYSFSYRYIGYLVFGVSIIFLINNLFFTVSRYNQYHGEQGVKPYQDLIDYVNRKKGLVFWSHPRASYEIRVGGINVFTPAYVEDLISTYDYTGFACLYQDGTCMTDAGGEWDQILIQYCNGKRENPVWGIGEIDYHGFSEEIDYVQTIFLMPQLDKEEIFEALRGGKMYAKLNTQKNDFYLDRFVVGDAISNKWGHMGDEIICKTNPRLYISGSCSTHPEDNINIHLIRGGEIIKTFQVKGPTFDIQFEDEFLRPGKKTYYRLNIESPHSTIISNPIFVQF